jgi:hypothetical protein
VNRIELEEEIFMHEHGKIGRLKYEVRGDGLFLVETDPSDGSLIREHLLDARPILVEPVGILPPPTVSASHVESLVQERELSGWETVAVFAFLAVVAIGAWTSLGLAFHYGPSVLYTIVWAVGLVVGVVAWPFYQIGSIIGQGACAVLACGT